MFPIRTCSIVILSLVGCQQTLPTDSNHLSPATAPASSTAFITDSFNDPLTRWTIELEKGGKVEARNGVLTIDVPGGATVWLKEKLTGPLTIEYTATMIEASPKGPNDRVSDLNCFWMATDSRSPADLFATQRSGKFADYDQLKTYYVGQGGNANTTTRFRRYIGEKSNRPLLPEHDLKDPDHLLKPNTPYRIKLVAEGNTIEYWCNGQRFFTYTDTEPYTSGHFGFRTVASHIQIRDFKVSRP